MDLLRRCWTRACSWEVLIALSSLVIICVIWAATLERVRFERADAVSDAVRQNSNLALALEEHTMRTLRTVDQALVQVAREYRVHGMQLSIKELVEQGTIDERLFHNLGVVDEDGALALSKVDIYEISVSDREYFREHQQKHSPVMFIGKPLLGRITNKWSIHMSRRITKADGSFGGVVFAAVDPDYFTGFYGKADLGSNGLMLLAGLDGIARARRMGDTLSTGQDMSKSSLLIERARAPEGNFFSKGVEEGIPRFMSYRTLPDYPLVVVVGTSAAVAFAAFHVRERYHYLWSSIATLFVILFAGSLIVALARHRRSMAALARRDARLSATFNQAAVGIAQTGLNGRFLQVNQRFCDLLGYTEQELLQLNFSDVTHPEDKNASHDFNNRLLASPAERPSPVMEKRYLHKSGATVWALLAVAVVRDSDGNTEYFVTVVQDITERKKAEVALRDSQEKLQTAIASGGVGLWDRDIVTGKAFYSREWKSQLGYEEHEIADDLREWERLLHPDDAKSADAMVNSCLKDPTVEYRVEFRMKHKNGTWRWILAQGSVHRDAQGVPRRIVGCHVDITERKHEEEQLRLSAKAFESIADGIIVTDAQRRLVSVNHAFSAITGYPPEEILGKTPRFLQSGRHDAAFYAAMWQEIDRNGHWRGEIWDRRKNGEIYPELLSISAVKEAAGAITHYVGVFTDISSLKRYEARLLHQAHHDALTGLPNRVLFQERFHEAIGRAKRHGHEIAVIFLDLDRFKNINDSVGHAVGDLLLEAVAKRLTASVRETDTVARVGGDEFAVLLVAINDNQAAAKVARKLLDALARPYQLAGHEFFISASIGISCYPHDAIEPETLFKNADAAMYRAKAEGRNNYQFFSEEMNARALEALMMGNSLRLALERREFLLHYQPQYDLKSGRITGVEALIRWLHPELGMVSPARFIPLAEEIGLIEPIGEWVLETACRQMRAWQDAQLPLQRVAVNLSARQFRNPDLSQRIAGILHENRLPAHYLELEVTESMVMQNPADATGVLSRLKAMGITIAVDDFGTGYSSLSYLKRLPIDLLKIDQSFVRGVPKDADDAAIIRAIIAMAHSLDLRLIAEGIETSEQRAFLEREGCEEGQGYLFSKPVPAIEIERLLGSPARQDEPAAVAAA